MRIGLMRDGATGRLHLAVDGRSVAAFHATVTEERAKEIVAFVGGVDHKDTPSRRAGPHRGAPARETKLTRAAETEPPEPVVETAETEVEAAFAETNPLGAAALVAAAEQIRTERAATEPPPDDNETTPVERPSQPAEPTTVVEGRIARDGEGPTGGTSDR